MLLDPRARFTSGSQVRCSAAIDGVGVEGAVACFAVVVELVAHGFALGKESLFLETQFYYNFWIKTSGFWHRSLRIYGRLACGQVACTKLHG